VLVPPATGGGPTGGGEAPATGAGAKAGGEAPATGAGPTGGGEAPATSGTTSGTVDHQAGSGDTKPSTGQADVGGVHGKGPGGAAPHGGPPAEHGGGHGDPSLHFNYFNFSYSGKDVMGGPFGDGKMIDHHGVEHQGEEAMSPPFVLMVLNFALLLGLLAWKGGPVFRKLAEDRHDQIKNALDEAAKLRAEAAAKLAELESKVKNADDEIKKLVEGLRADAEADKARILENAAKQSAAMKRDAELRIAAEIEYARAALTKEVTAAAALATEKILREQLQPADQQKLVASFIADVQGAAATAKEIR
jgi:F-type H+-transporting ATPase subunit b